MHKNDGGFPVYVLDDDTIVFSKKNINHDIFWRKRVSKIVAKKYKINNNDLHNLPYCQKRARIIDNIIYCGEKLSKRVIKKLEDIVGTELKLIYDEHETRCEISVSQFKSNIPYQ